MKPGKNIIHIIVVIGIVVLIAVIFFFTGKKEKTDRYQLQPRKPRSLEPMIAKAEIDPPQPTSSDFIRGMPTLEDPGIKHVKYQYQWFVNGELIPEMKDRLLEKNYYKKGDKIYYRVKATSGIYESRILQSTTVTVGNSNPVIDFKPVGKFNVPGRFRYLIQAADPDNDPLTYHLIAPLDLGIRLNPDTGEITWDIKKRPDLSGLSDTLLRPEDEKVSPGQKMKEKSQQTKPQEEHTMSPGVKIVFEVRDSDGATTEGSITLNLLKGEEEPS